MVKFLKVSGLLFSISILVLVFSSCTDTRQIAYFSEVKDSTRIVSPAGIEPVIQKNDILSIIVSSLSRQATEIFNMPNLPITPSTAISPGYPQTAGYLVSQSGDIKFPILGSIHAEGLTPKELENEIARLLIDRKLLYDPIVTSRFLNFRVTVLGEVTHPGVVYAAGDQLSLLEALGLAGDLTIFAKRDNVMLIRQQDGEKLIKRIDLTNDHILKSPYYFLKSNDIIYVEPGKNKLASTDATLRVLPVVFSGISVLVVLLTTILK